jgi:hypothetical protein
MIFMIRGCRFALALACALAGAAASFAGGPQAAQPDLKPVEISFRGPDSSAVPLRVEVVVRVRNDGACIRNTHFRLDLLCRQRPDGDWTKVKEWDCPPLCANAEGAVQTTVEIAQAGSYDFRAVVDAGEAIAESDESNNLLEVGREIVPPGPAAPPPRD